MLIRTSLAAVLLTLSAAACARAQEPSSAPAPMTVSGTRILNPRPAAIIGISMDLQGERPVVQSVTPDGPAARAGVAPGDTLLSIDGNDTRGPNATFRGATPGRRYVLRVRRGTEEKELILVAVAPRARPSNR